MHNALLATLAAALLAGCAIAPPVPGAGYVWVASPTAPRCRAATWVQVPWPTPCGGLACTVGCTVYSGYSEARARALPADRSGESLWDHERRHWRDGMVHPGA